jgi:type IV pilus assembly protein PilN
LHEIASTIPIDRLWITNLSLKGNNLNIKGVAMDNHTVALFMRRLEASKLFQIVNLTNVHRQLQAKKNNPQEELMIFDLNIEISFIEQKIQQKKTGQKG